MAGSRRPADVAGMARVRARLEAWRRGRKRGSRIPARLWDAAAKLARSHGINRVAQVLRLDYYDLKERAGALGRAGGKEPVAGSEAFVELGSAGWAAQGECLIEIERRDGATLRVRVSSGEDLDLASLTATFLRARR